MSRGERLSVAYGSNGGLFLGERRTGTGPPGEEPRRRNKSKNEAQAQAPAWATGLGKHWHAAQRISGTRVHGS